MTAPSEAFVVDSDSHVLEPLDLWENYLEAEYRDRAIRAVRTPEGVEQLWMDDQILLPGGLANLGGVELDRRRIADPSAGLTYLDGAPPGSMFGDARLELYDEWGIDAGLALPTIGILWDTEDLKLGNAYARAYNDWLYDFQAPDRSRIVAAAHLHLKDPEEALRELRRNLARGFKAAFVPSERPAGKPFAHPDFAPIWRELEETGVPVVMHIVVRLRRIVRQPGVLAEWYDAGRAPRLFSFGLGATLQIMPAVCAMVADGLFDEFPRLKVLCVEAGAGWAAYAMDRLDAKYQHFGFAAPLELEKPSDYFRRNLFFCAEPEERTIGAMLELVGEDRILWGSDYPHIDSHIEAAQQIRASVAGLSEERQRRVLGENARSLFDLS